MNTKALGVQVKTNLHSCLGVGRQKQPKLMRLWFMIQMLPQAVDGGIGKEGTSGVEDGIDGEGGGEVALSSKLQ